MYAYIRPQGAAVWHNHDLKSDQPTNLMYVCYHIVYRFSPSVTRDSRYCNLGFHTPDSYMCERRPPFN